MMKGGTVMANRKMYAVAITILQTMIDVFPKDHLDFMFAGFLDPGDIVLFCGVRYQAGIISIS